MNALLEMRCIIGECIVVGHPLYLHGVLREKVARITPRQGLGGSNKDGGGGGGGVGGGTSLTHFFQARKGRNGAAAAAAAIDRETCQTHQGTYMGKECGSGGGRESTPRRSQPRSGLACLSSTHEESKDPPQGITHAFRGGGEEEGGLRECGANVSGGG